MVPAAMIEESERKRDLISNGPVERQAVGQPGRTALPWQEKLLLTSVLIVVAGWILLRLSLTFLASH